MENLNAKYNHFHSPGKNQPQLKLRVIRQCALIPSIKSHGVSRCITSAAIKYLTLVLLMASHYIITNMMLSLFGMDSPWLKATTETAF